MNVAVLDLGKTNVKLVLLDDAGHVLDQRQQPNRPRPAPPWLHPDLEAIESWLGECLRGFTEGHRVDAFVASAHGSGGVLVDDRGPVLPAIDYEAMPPAEVIEGYAALVPPFPERGWPLLEGASHFGRQLYWIRRTHQEALAAARHFLALPQYFAWRLTDVAASDVTLLGAQSHLWSPLRADFTTLVDELGCRRLLPPLAPSWTSLGPPKPEWQLPPGMRVLVGIHDSTANLYLYQRAGLEDFALLSTGTWIVGMHPGVARDQLDETRSMGITSDVFGSPVTGLLAMTGREYAVLTGDAVGLADPEVMVDLMRRGTLALPSFAPWDGIYQGSADRGRIEGPEPRSREERIALATLYAVLVAEACLELLGAQSTAVIDGGFTADPAFAGVVAALRPDLEVLVEPEGRGTIGGAALLASHNSAGVSPLSLQRAGPLELPGLLSYRNRWRAAVARHLEEQHEHPD